MSRTATGSRGQKGPAHAEGAAEKYFVVGLKAFSAGEVMDVERVRRNGKTRVRLCSGMRAAFFDTEEEARFAVLDSIAGRKEDVAAHGWKEREGSEEDYEIYKTGSRFIYPKCMYCIREPNQSVVVLFEKPSCGTVIAVPETYRGEAERTLRAAEHRTDWDMADFTDGDRPLAITITHEYDTPNIVQVFSKRRLKQE